tara:strand:+ start:572 stop:1513 length:942 start_codon:yes stop_codon:yes gene_type:complete
MKINKPKFWDKKYSIIAFLLMPLTLIVILLIFFKKKFTKCIEINIPIICIGNIYLGGTGKTPASIYIAKELSKLNKNPAIVKKFYADHKDEHKLIKKEFKNLILNENRVAGIIMAKKKNYDAVILDDGFQDYRFKKDLNILCFNQNQLIGNGLVLPSGPLRERLCSLREAHIILINGKKDIEFERKILKKNKNLEIFYSKYKPTNIEQFRNQKLLAIAGIGNPNNFFKLLYKNNLKVEKELIYPDHYEFCESEIMDIIKESKSNNYQIIMTEKDYFKINNFNYDEIKYLKIQLEIDEKEKFLNKISKLYDKKN